MDNETYDKEEKSLKLREELVEIEEKRLAGRPDDDARDVLAELRARHNGYVYN